MPQLTLIREDSVGIWASVGNYVSRPVKPTQFKVGDKVKSHHFGGTAVAGLGKDDTCKRGQYLEEWTTTGQMADYHDEYSEEELLQSFRWYRNRFMLRNPLYMGGYSHEERKNLSISYEEDRKILDFLFKEREKRGTWY